MLKVVYLSNTRPSFSTESHLTATLRDLGHEVITVQEDEVHAPGVADIVERERPHLFLYTRTEQWLRGDGLAMLDRIHALNIPSVSYHLDLYAGLQARPPIKGDPFWSTKYCFTPDGGSPDFFKALGVNHYYLKPGVYKKECYIAEPDDALRADVAFVGSYGYHTEWPYRQKLVDWLRATYGSRFAKHGNPESTIREHRLNQLYASAKVIVGDTLCLGFDHPYYWSDRVNETLGRGGFLIHPWIKGMEEEFKNGVHLVYYDYNDFDQLKGLIDYYITHDDEREQIRHAGHNFVKQYATYHNRVQQMLGVLAVHEPTISEALVEMYTTEPATGNRPPRHRPEWIERTQLVSSHIPAGSTVVEFGAGTKELGNLLNGVPYTGYDKEDFDLESDTWPEIAPHDTAALVGVLEWIEDVPKLLQRMTARRLIVSYVPSDDHPHEVRVKNGWKSHYRKQDLIKEFRRAHYMVINQTGWNDQTIFTLFRSSHHDLYSCGGRLWNGIPLYAAFCGYRSGNAGDVFSKALVERLSSLKVDMHDVKDWIKETRLVAAGSIAEDIPYDYAGHVWGTGIMFEHHRADTPLATVAAVRGHLTKERWIGVDWKPVALGDPGLLVDMLMPEYFGTHKFTKRYEVGVIPHYVDAENMGVREFLRKNSSATSIDICDRLPDVLRAISECEVVVASTLHGLIFADSLGVPNVWMYLSDKIQGGSFKFRDYYSVFGMTDPKACLFNAGMSVQDIRDLAHGYSRPGIEQIKQGLIDAFPFPGGSKVRPQGDFDQR